MILRPIDRRRELEALLKPPSGPGVYVDFAISLALKHAWRVNRSTDAGPAHASWRADYWVHTMYVHPLDSDEAFAAYLHEAGHLEDPLLPERPRSHEQPSDSMASIEAEVFAWLFAITCAGYRWNRAMQATLEKSLATYVSFVDTFEEGGYHQRCLLNAVINHGREQARHIVRTLGTPAPPISPLLAEFYQQVSLT